MACSDCSTNCSGDCSSVCSSSCSTTCSTGCSATCESNCSTTCSTGCSDGCSSVCSNTCSTGCSDGCSSICSNTCSTTCSTGCSATCESNCSTTCSTGCSDGCSSVCSNTCSTTCSTGCSATCESNCSTTSDDDVVIIADSGTCTDCTYLCYTGCFDECSGTCSGSCEGDCSGTSEVTTNSLIENLENDTSLGLSDSKKETITVMGETLLDAGYEPAFVAGVLGNILAEGTAGKFESSSYSNIDSKPDYLIYVDEYYNYNDEFSGKNISDVGVQKTYSLLLELEADNYVGKFGLGCVQWTGSRTMDLVECYIEVAGVDGYPSTEENLKAESMLIAQEFNGSYNYIYSEWVSDYSEQADAAYQAGSIVCIKYEVPVDRYTKAVTRGNSAQAIYEVMIG